jgi:hypothetical protein
MVRHRRTAPALQIKAARRTRAVAGEGGRDPHPDAAPPQRSVDLRQRGWCGETYTTSVSPPSVIVALPAPATSPTPCACTLPPASMASSEAKVAVKEVLLPMMGLHRGGEGALSVARPFHVNKVARGGRITSQIP